MRGEIDGLLVHLGFGALGLYLVLDWDRVICLIDTRAWDFEPGCRGRSVVNFLDLDI